MIVADASVIVPLVIQRHDLGRASEALLEAFPSWGCPPLWRSEVLHALGRYVRHRGLGLPDATTAFERAEQIVVEIPMPADASILRIMAEVGCSGYDAHYVALSLSTGAPLVTNDRRLARAFPELARLPGEMLAE